MINYIDLTEKVKKLEDSNQKLGVEVSFKHQDNSRLDDDLVAKTEELKYYEDQLKSADATRLDDTRSENSYLLKNTARGEREKDLASVDEILKDENTNTEDEDETMNIATQLEVILKDINHGMNEIPITHSSAQQAENYNLYCQAVMVVLVDSEGEEDKGKAQFLVQTFKIDLNTNFEKLKQSILSFWDLKERENEFTLKFVDEEGESSNVRDDYELVDVFLKGKSNMKKAKFLFIMNKLSKFIVLYSENSKGFGQVGNSKASESINKFNSKFTIDSATERLLSKFLGLSSYLQTKLIRIKKKLNEKEQIIIPKKWSGVLGAVFSCCHFSMLIIFAIFTIISLMYKCPPDSSFFINETVSKIFDKKVDLKLLTKSKIIDDIITRLEGLTYAGDLLNRVVPVSPLRISFVKYFIRILILV